jgi:hypothetical protein
MTEHIVHILQVSTKKKKLVLSTTVLRLIINNTKLQINIQLLCPQAINIRHYM